MSSIALAAAATDPLFYLMFSLSPLPSTHFPLTHLLISLLIHSSPSLFLSPSLLSPRAARSGGSAAMARRGGARASGGGATELQRRRRRHGGRVAASASGVSASAGRGSGQARLAGARRRGAGGQAAARSGVGVSAGRGGGAGAAGLQRHGSSTSKERWRASAPAKKFSRNSVPFEPLLLRPQLERSGNRS
ncbi:hypothetical protein U9M48_020897 [Paspalum notatum var. saurae]|uniref:Uncharacterized protein n=1 Tax=Paspalum notatum var. saurae TaxID=547442 RepID=A0AAQ3WS69_PASNO